MNYNLFIKVKTKCESIFMITSFFYYRYSNSNGYSLYINDICNEHIWRKGLKYIIWDIEEQDIINSIISKNYSYLIDNKFTCICEAESLNFLKNKLISIIERYSRSDYEKSHLNNIIKLY